MTSRLAHAAGRALGRVRWGIVLLVVSVLAVAGEGAFLTAALTGYGCESCHVPQAAADANRATPHASVDCLECHRSSGALSLPLLNLRAAGNLWTAIDPWSEPTSSRAHIDQRNCLDCHDEIVAQDVSRTSRGIVMSHREPVAAGERCLSCHQVETHTGALPSAGRDHGSCTGCHDGDTAPNACAVCHVEEPSRETAALPGIEAVIHESGSARAHGMGDMDTCTLCHARTFCKTCHGLDLPHARVSFPYLHGAEALEVGAEVCAGCHARSFCSGCHQIDMPHTAGYLTDHPMSAKTLGRQVCERCHLPTDCTTCHDEHVHPGIPPRIPEQPPGER